MRSSTRLILALGLGNLLLAGGSMAAAGETGRDFAQCIHSCSSARAACGQQCVDQCKALFPQGSGPRSACVSRCVHDCEETGSDCKTVCKAIKNGQSPNIP